MTFVLLQLIMNAKLLQLLVRIWAAADINSSYKGTFKNRVGDGRIILKRNYINVNDMG
jgi:limonene-1,2-epoxide hydrolase